MSERGRQELPEELELMAPGPQLAALLASVDRRRLSGEDRVRLVQARNRLIAHEQAELLADMYAVSRDEQPSSYRDGREASRYPWAEVELAFALSWTRMAAGGRLEQARQLIEDLPAVHAALAAGDIDLPKAWVIGELADWLGDVAGRHLAVQRLRPVGGAGLSRHHPQAPECGGGRVCQDPGSHVCGAGLSTTCPIMRLGSYRGQGRRWAKWAIQYG